MGQTVDMLKIILGIEAKGFAGVQSQVKSLTESMQHSLANLRNAVAGYFTVSTVTQIARSVVDLGTRWEELSINTGQSRDAVQKWDWAFRKVGKSIEHGISLFDQLEESRRKALTDPGEGGDKARFFFKRVGLTEEDVRTAERGADIAIKMGQLNQRDDVKYRAAMVSEFGSQRTPWAIGAFDQMAHGEGPPLMDPDTVKQLYDASFVMQEAMLEFKIAAAPLVTAMLEWVAEAVNFFSRWPDQKERMSRQNALASGLEDLMWGKQSKGKSPQQIAEFHKLYNQVHFNKLLGIGNELSQDALNDVQARIHEINTGKKVSRDVVHAPSQETLVERFARRTGLPYVNEKEVERFAKRTGLPYSTAEERAEAKKAKDKKFEDYKLETAEDYRTRREAFTQSVMQYGTIDQKRASVRELMNSQMGEAKRLRDLGETGKARTIESGVIGMAGKAAEFEKIVPQWNPDSLAKVGGYIGGAVAGIDPSLFYQRSMLEVQQQILMTVQGGAALLEALRNPQPSRPLAEDVQ